MGKVGAEWIKNGDVSGSAVQFDYLFLHRNSLIMSPTVLLIHYITNSATWPLSDITGGSLSDHGQLPLDKRLHTTFFLICTSAPKDLQTHFNV